MALNAPLHTALRAGIAGILLASLIYLLWKISLRIDGRFFFQRESDFLIATLGAVLWAVWFSVSQVILIAADELHSSANSIKIEKLKYHLHPYWQRLNNDK